MNKIKDYRIEGKNKEAYDIAKPFFDALVKKVDNGYEIEKQNWNLIKNLVYELTIVGYYLGKKQDCKWYYDLIWLYKGDKIVDNYQFYIDKIDGFALNRIGDRVNVPYIGNDNNNPKYFVCNPSIIRYGDGFLVSLRMVNYLVNDGNYQYFESEWKIKSLVYLVNVTQDWQIIKQYKVVETNRHVNENSFIKGMEDARLFWHDDGILGFSCTVGDTMDGTLSIGLGRMEQIEKTKAMPDTDEIKVVIEVIKSPYEKGVEKNWLRWKEGVFLYDIEDGKLFDTRDKEITYLYKDNIIFTNHRGGAGPLNFEGGKLLLMHSHLDIVGKRERFYIHRFVWLQKGEKKITNWFYFKDQTIEFATGFEYYNENTFIIGFGYRDCQDYYITIPTNTIHEMLKPLPKITLL